MIRAYPKNPFVVCYIDHKWGYSDRLLVKTFRATLDTRIPNITGKNLSIFFLKKLQ